MAAIYKFKDKLLLICYILFEKYHSAQFPENIGKYKKRYKRYFCNLYIF